MKLAAHPLWLVGFRPFFVLACLSGLSLPLLWALFFTGALAAPVTTFATMQWHAHEMFFGFGWAVLGGFLLTSTKNWTKVRGYHGASLIFLVAAWVFERIGMWFEGSWPHFLFLLSNNLFLVAIVAMLSYTLIRHREDDAYRDNYFFVLILPVFLLAKHLMLSAEYAQIGWSMALGLYRIAFLVMLVRTLTQFMQAAFNAQIVHTPVLNKVIVLVGLLMVFESLLPAPLSAGIALLLAGLLTGRLMFWKPLLALKRIEIGIMYLGYGAIVAQLLFEFARHSLYPEWTLSTSIHIFTIGALGLIIPGMVVRISKGHTGRKVVFDVLDKLVLWIMPLAFLFRLVLPQLYPAVYAYWIYLAATCWFICFGILGWRYIPMLMQARIDGREH
jgi:uncharacterized protein involved in response to NO